MELKVKSLLIALVLGDGSLIEQKKYKPKNKRNVVLEIQHGCKQEEYIKYKANICRRLTGTLCKIKKVEYKRTKINGISIGSSYGFKFTSGHRYYKVLRKWLYPNDKKHFRRKYLNYLNAEGIAIWYMDDGCTYIDKRRWKSFQGSCEFSTHVDKEEAEMLKTYFLEKWNLKFYLHKVKPGYNIRCYNKEALKFINLIKPFVPDCMAYKVTIPNEFIHELETCQNDTMI